jgi:hypothetical protein
MARLARRRDSYPVRHIYSAIRFVLTFFQGHYGQLHLRAWTESNCQGKIASPPSTTLVLRIYPAVLSDVDHSKAKSSWISP